MPVANTTPAGRNQHAAHVARMAEARAKAEHAADTLNGVPLDTIPEPPLFAEPKQRPITMQISAVLEGFTVAISFDGTIAQLPGAIERLRALGATPTSSAPLAPLATPDDLPEGWRLCKKHGAPMRPRSKQNDTWHSHNVGTSDNPIYCKGYRGADSPGYEVD